MIRWGNDPSLTAWSNRLHIHFTGCGYYYAEESGRQRSKMYKTKWALEKYAKIWD